MADIETQKKLTETLSQIVKLAKEKGKLHLQPVVEKTKETTSKAFEVVAQAYKKSAETGKDAIQAVKLISKMSARLAQEKAAKLGEAAGVNNINSKDFAIASQDYFSDTLQLQRVQAHNSDELVRLTNHLVEIVRKGEIEDEDFREELRRSLKNGAKPTQLTAANKGAFTAAAAGGAGGGDSGFGYTAGLLAGRYAGRAWRGIKNVAGTAKDAAVKAGSKVLDLGKKAGGKVLEAGKNIVSKVAPGAVEAVKNVGAKIAERGSAAVQGVKGVASKVAERGANLVSGAKDVAKSAGGLIKGAFSKIGGAISSGISSVAKGAGEATDVLMKHIPAAKKLLPKLLASPKMVAPAMSKIPVVGPVIMTALEGFNYMQTKEEIDSDKNLNNKEKDLLSSYAKDAAMAKLGAGALGAAVGAVVGSVASPVGSAIMSGLVSVIASKGAEAGVQRNYKPKFEALAKEQNGVVSPLVKRYAEEMGATIEIPQTKEEKTAALNEANKNKFGIDETDGLAGAIGAQLANPNAGPITNISADTKINTKSTTVTSKDGVSTHGEQSHESRVDATNQFVLTNGETLETQLTSTDNLYEVNNKHGSSHTLTGSNRLRDANGNLIAVTDRKEDDEKFAADVEKSKKIIADVNNAESDSVTGDYALTEEEREAQLLDAINGKEKVVEGEGNILVHNMNAVKLEAMDAKHKAEHEKAKAEALAKVAEPKPVEKTKEELANEANKDKFGIDQTNGAAGALGLKLTNPNDSGSMKISTKNTSGVYGDIEMSKSDTDVTRSFKLENGETLQLQASSATGHVEKDGKTRTHASFATTHMLRDEKGNLIAAVDTTNGDDNEVNKKFADEVEKNRAFKAKLADAQGAGDDIFQSEAYGDNSGSIESAESLLNLAEESKLQVIKSKQNELHEAERRKMLEQTFAPKATVKGVASSADSPAALAPALAQNARTDQATTAEQAAKAGKVTVINKGGDTIVNGTSNDGGKKPTNSARPDGNGSPTSQATFGK